MNSSEFFKQLSHGVRNSVKRKVTNVKLLPQVVYKIISESKFIILFRYRDISVVVYRLLTFQASLAPWGFLARGEWEANGERTSHELLSIGSFKCTVKVLFFHGNKGKSTWPATGVQRNVNISHSTEFRKVFFQMVDGALERNVSDINLLDTLIYSFWRGWLYHK
jgi:hypothetical protein